MATCADTYESEGRRLFESAWACALITYARHMALNRRLGPWHLPDRRPRRLQRHTRQRPADAATCPRLDLRDIFTHSQFQGDGRPGTFGNGTHSQKDLTSCSRHALWCGRRPRAAVSSAREFAAARTACCFP